MIEDCRWNSYFSHQYFNKMFEKHIYVVIWKEEIIFRFQNRHSFEKFESLSNVEKEHKDFLIHSIEINVLPVCAIQRKKMLIFQIAYNMNYYVAVSHIFFFIFFLNIFIWWNVIEYKLKILYSSCAPLFFQEKNISLTYFSK